MKNKLNFKCILAVLLCIMLGICGCSSASMADGNNGAGQAGSGQTKEGQPDGKLSKTDADESPDDAGASEGALETAQSMDQSSEGGQEASQGGSETSAEDLEGDTRQLAADNRTDLFRSHGKLSVKGTNLVDKNGKPFQLRGISTHGLSWFPQYVNKDAFKTLRDEWGCNTVRLAMYTAEGNGYCTGDAANRKKLRKLVNSGVKYATSLDMYVIVDWHILSDGNPNTYKKQAKAYFNYMSKKYKNNDHVIYEICNEPNGDTTWAQVKSYAKTIIKTIRKNDKDAIIIVGSPTWSQDVDIAAQDPIKGKNIMYSLHFYAATHKENLRQKAQTAMDMGLPLFVTEFGFCDASGNGSIDTGESEKWINYLNENNISFCMWSLCNKAEAASALRPECTSTSNWKTSEISDAGKLLIKYLHGSIGGSSQGNEKGASGNGGSSGGSGNNESGSGSGGSGDNGSGGNSGGSGDNGNNGTSGGNAADDTGSSKEKSVTSQGCKATVKITNSWADADNSYFQYDAVLENGDEMKAKNWKLKLTFNKAFTVQQGWCGTFHKNGKVLTISPEEYNQKVKKDTEISNIGFIIKATAGTKVVKMELVLK